MMSIFEIDDVNDVIYAYNALFKIDTSGIAIGIDTESLRDI